MKNKAIRNLMREMAGGHAGAKGHGGRRKKMVQMTAAALCTALVLGGTGVTMCTLAAEREGAQKTEAEASGEQGGIAEAQGAGQKADGKADAQGAGQKADGKADVQGAGQASGVKNGGKVGTAEGELAKEETVYILANADGSTRKIIVSDLLQNGTGADTLRDVSELTNIRNVNGEEGFTLDGDNVKVWDAKGGDICYQGSTDKQPPVSLAVTYMLDGKEISPEELAGKSGKVKIRFDYTNEQYEYAEVDGVRTKVYVPFAVVSGMLLDHEVFSNVEVSGGRLIDDGDRMVVLGYALPGMQENLGEAGDQLELPDSLEITADVENFEMGMTASIATNELFNGLEPEEENLLEDLKGSLEELTDAMEQLMDGSSQLYDGLCTLSDKSGELADGIDRLSDGAAQLKDGVGALDGGAAQLQDGAARLRDGAASLQSGLNTLAANNGTLNGGARQVFETLLATAQTQLSAAGVQLPEALTPENYGELLNQVIASLDGDAVYQQAYAAVIAGVEEKRGYIESQVTDAVRAEVEARVTAAVRQEVENKVTAVVKSQVTEGVLGSLGMTGESYEAAWNAGLITEEQKAQIEEAVGVQMESDAVRQQVAANTEMQMESDEVKEIIRANMEQQMAGDEVRQLIASNIETQVQKAIADNMSGAEVQGKLSQASAGLQAITNLKASLDSYNSFYAGLQSYTAGVAQAAGGAGQIVSGAEALKGGVEELRNGSAKLYSGAGELCDGITTMKKGTPALTDGISQLRDGSEKLSHGLQEFNDEGIQKLEDAVDGDLSSLSARLHAALDASKNYKTFSGLGDEMDGRVKFIYRTDAIEMER